MPEEARAERKMMGLKSEYTQIKAMAKVFGNRYMPYTSWLEMELAKARASTPLTQAQAGNTGSAPFPDEADLVATFPALLPPTVDVKSFKFGVNLTIDFFKKWFNGTHA